MHLLANRVWLLRPVAAPVDRAGASIFAVIMWELWQSFAPHVNLLKADQN